MSTDEDGGRIRISEGYEGGSKSQPPLRKAPGGVSGTWIKICGITNLEDALQAAALGVDALGFVFAPSPRRVDPSAARRIIAGLPPSPSKVGVFVDQEIGEVRRIAGFCGLDVLQLHGRETPEYVSRLSLPVIKALPVGESLSREEMERYPMATLLLDALSPGQAGGTGKTFRWELAREAGLRGDFILSGGLSPGNVSRAIQQVRPWGVDVCSGVERAPGRKDPLKTAAFVKEVQRANETAG